MKRLSLISVFLFLLSANSYACREVTWSSSEWAKNAQSVYAGRVTHASHSNEAAVTKTGSLQVDVTAGRVDLVVAIAVEETLKGVPKDSLRILLSWCGGGSAEVADKVVVFRLGEKWHIKASLSEVAEARKALTNQ